MSYGSNRTMEKILTSSMEQYSNIVCFITYRVQSSLQATFLQGERVKGNEGVWLAYLIARMYKIHKV